MTGKFARVCEARHVGKNFAVKLGYRYGGNGWWLGHNNAPRTDLSVTKPRSCVGMGKDGHRGGVSSGKSLRVADIQATAASLVHNLMEVLNFHFRILPCDHPRCCSNSSVDIVPKGKHTGGALSVRKSNIGIPDTRHLVSLPQ